MLEVSALDTPAPIAGRYRLRHAEVLDDDCRPQPLAPDRIRAVHHLRQHRGDPRRPIGIPVVSGSGLLGGGLSVGIQRPDVTGPLVRVIVAVRRMCSGRRTRSSVVGGGLGPGDALFGGRTGVGSNTINEVAINGSRHRSLLGIRISWRLCWTRRDVVFTEPAVPLGGYFQSQSTRDMRALLPEPGSAALARRPAVG